MNIYLIVMMGEFKKIGYKINSVLILILVFSFCFSNAFAQKPFTIPVITKSNAFVLQVQKSKDINIVYLGEKLNAEKEYLNVSQTYKQGDDYAKISSSPYTPSGSRNLTEPAISVTHADGNNSLDLKYESHNQQKLDNNVSLLSVVLRDSSYPFQVTLFYKSYFNENVLEQWSVINHKESNNVVLQKFASSNIYLQSPNYYLTHYHGDWAKELQPEETKLTHGIKTLDSKLGTRANLFMPSTFMISLDKPSTENEGKVLLGALEYSGNFRIDFEIDNLDNLKIIAGINNYASTYSLKPNEDFKTPVFLYTLSNNGKGEASRNLHNWAKKYKVLDGQGNRLTLLNNWEATYFDFNEKKLAKLLKDTKLLGVDLFLLDDGWFANKYPRNNDSAGLGDWQENKTKLPNGISYLVKEAEKNNVKFGIWLEPEMINPKSELYEQHPDWVIKQPNRQEYYFRNQLVLDLSNPKVQDFVYEIIDNLFAKNPKLAYIKWDCNAVIYNAYSAHLSNQSHFYIEYMRGLYSILERVRAKYPKLPMMLCSGGGGRVDYAALQYFTEFWPSDNTDPIERIFIQWQYSYFYPSITSSNHVTDWGHQPIKFKTDVAMMGKLGFDIVVSKLKPEELLYCQEAIKNYNSLKSIIWSGNQYRLSDPMDNDVASMMYIDDAKSSGVIFNYLVNSRYGAGSKFPIKLNGLDNSKMYKLKEINLYPKTISTIDSVKIYSGDFLMKIGINPDVNSVRKSVVLKIEEVK